ncbi:MAG: peptide deformylase [Myxococcales bacterium]|nr:MAG: peptide deformylase [Myxococcales bacterium]
MILKIAQIGEPVLRKTADKLSIETLLSEETQSFIDSLVETMRHANGAGLAANQVFMPLQICAIEVHNNPRYPYKPNIPLTVLVNPILSPLDDATFINYEGCLSVPNLRGEVPRYIKLRVQAWDRHGGPIDEVVHGLKAATFQHEVDHLNGKLFLDRVENTASLCTWENFEKFHALSFIKRAKALVEQTGS